MILSLNETMEAQKINNRGLQALKLIVATFFLLFAVIPNTSHARAVGGVRADITVGTSSPYTVRTTEPLSCTSNGYLRWWFSDNTVNTTGANSTLNPIVCTGGFYATSTALQNGGITGATIAVNYGSSATSSGFYYAYICDTNPCTTTNIEYFIEVYYDGLSGETIDGYSYFPPQTIATTSTTQIAKNIQILKPEYGTTTATTTFTYSIKFKTPFSLDYRPTTTRKVVIIDAISYAQEYSTSTTIAPNTSENIIFNGTATTPIGSKYISAYYTDINGVIYSEVDTIFFNVATNTYLALTGLVSPNATTSELSQINCTLYDIGCQFQKALVFLFIPPKDSLEKWGNLWQSIADKKPFGYFTITKNSLENLDESAVSAFDLGTIPFMDSIFTPFRTLIAGILWSIFAIYFFNRRLIHIDI